MTIVSTTNRADYVGSGSTGPYSFNFRIFAATDLIVTKRDLSNVETTLAYPTDYSVAGVGVGAGGSITLTSALTSGFALTIRRAPPLLQSTSIRNQGTYFPATVEDALDYGTMTVQELATLLANCLTFPVSVNPSTTSPKVPVPVTNAVLVWNGSAFVWDTTAPINISGNAATAGSAATAALAALATALANAHTISMTGDVSYTSSPFDGSAPVTGTATLASVATPGTFGDSLNVPRVTVDAKGRLTAVSTVPVSSPLPPSYPVLSGETGVASTSYPYLNIKRYGAVGDNVTDDTAAIQTAITNAALGTAIGSVITIPGQATPYLVTGAPLVNGIAGLTFIGWGATIRLSGANAQSLRFAGQCDDTAIHGLHTVGSGVAADNHAGPGTIVGVASGTGGNNLRLINVTAAGVARGMHFESSNVVWRDAVFSGCRATNIVGTASGTGYGITIASFLGVKVIGCYFDQCQRHSLYDANSQDVAIIGNTFRRHRDSVATGAIFPACVVARRPNVSVIGNSFDSCADTALSIESDETDVAQPTFNVTVLGNIFHGSVSRDIVVGNDSAGSSGVLSDVVIDGNTIDRVEAASVGVESIRVFNGLGVRIANNRLRMLNAYSVVKAAIVVGTGAYAASLVDDLTIENNRCEITSAGGNAAYFIEMASPWCTGTSSVVVRNNRFKRTGSGALILYDAALTSRTIKVIENNNLTSPVSADRGDMSVTLEVETDAPVQRFATALTGDATVFLDTAGAQDGDAFRVIRTGLGAHTLNVGGLKTIPNSTAAFVDVVYDGPGGAWRLAAYGTL